MKITNKQTSNSIDIPNNMNDNKVNRVANKNANGNNT